MHCGILSDLFSCSALFFSLGEILHPLLVQLTGIFPPCCEWDGVDLWSGVSVSSPVPSQLRRDTKRFPTLS